jgi:alanyl-tRNA synthetase
MQKSLEKTVKLYEEDAYNKEFEAVVMSCEKDKDRYLVSLDRTAFYPEGGGQPADTGYIAGIRVTDTQEKDGIIYHYTENPLEPGISVQCSIDWKRRFSNMQQHSGEHILSGIIVQLSGFDNVGFHIGSEFVTLDYNGPLTDEILKEAESRANSAIYANLPVNVRVYSNEEIIDVDYRSKKEIEGPVRIVEVPGCDRCACCGTHVARAGEIGIIKIIKAQNYKGGTRVYILCGNRALEHFRGALESVDKISTLLSARPDQVFEATAQLLEESEEQKSRIAGLQTKLFEIMAEQVENEFDGNIYTTIMDDLSADELRQYALILVEKVGTCLLFSANANEGYRYACASSEIDCREITVNLNKTLEGRGGGTPKLTQGAVKSGREKIESFIASLT